jgi:hypothetical protein
MCPQCETRLDLPPPPPQPVQPADPTHVCKHCKNATVFPPVGQRLTPVDIWYTLSDATKLGDGAAPDCFVTSFIWRRQDRLD